MLFFSFVSTISQWLHQYIEVHQVKVHFVLPERSRQTMQKKENIINASYSIVLLFIRNSTELNS
jgi:hypothetical protein